MTTTGASFLAARTRAGLQGVGRPIPRKEDPRLVERLGLLFYQFILVVVTSSLDSSDREA